MTVTDEIDAWARVGTQVTNRMRNLGFSIQEVARKTGLSRETISEIARGRPRRRTASTLAKVCVVLGWTTVSIDRVLEGGEPEALEYEERRVIGDLVLLERLRERMSSAVPETESEAIARLTEETALLREQLGDIQTLLERLLGDEEVRERAALSEQS